MSVEVCELLKDNHFLCKLADAVATLYGFKALLEFGYIRNAVQAAVVSIALAGGFAASCILMYMYKIGEKNDNAEKLLLISYGIMNIVGAYVSWIRLSDYLGCPTTIYNPVMVMLFATIFTALCMLGEAFYDLFKKEE